MSQSTMKMKLRKVDLGTKTLMEFCTEKVNASSKKYRNKGLCGDYDDYIQAFGQEFLSKYVIIGTSVFEITDMTENEPFTLASKNEDGTFNFVINYDDGANFWTEFLEEKDFI